VQTAAGGGLGRRSREPGGRRQAAGMAPEPPHTRGAAVPRARRRYDAARGCRTAPAASRLAHTRLHWCVCVVRERGERGETMPRTGSRLWRSRSTNECISRSNSLLPARPPAHAPVPACRTSVCQMGASRTRRMRTPPGPRPSPSALRPLAVKLPRAAQGSEQAGHAPGVRGELGVDRATLERGRHAALLGLLVQDL